MHKRNRDTWLPRLKWKTRQTPKNCTKKDQEEQEKGCQTRKVDEDLIEPQDDTDIRQESSSFKIEESQSRQRGKKCRKSHARSSLIPLSSPPHLSPDKSPFVQRFFMDHQEEHSENQPQVLVTCSQSQSFDWHQAQKTDQACQNLMEPINEMKVEETQGPSLAFRDEEETQILEDTPNEDLGGVNGGFNCSQDFFQEPNKQACPLKETSLENNNKVLKCHMKKKKKKKSSSLNLADMEAEQITYSKSQRTLPTEIISPAVDKRQARKEKEKKISDDNAEHVCPSLPLEDYTSRSRENDFSSLSKDIDMVNQEENPETTLFTYGGLKFLKRKKSKKTDVPKISDNPTAMQEDPGRNEGSAPHVDNTVKQKKRKKVKNGELLEDPVDTLPEISVPADLSLSLQDCSVGCASVSGFKPKTKRKKDKNDGLVEETVDASPEISVSTDSSLLFQDSSISALVGGSKPKKKRKKDKHAQPEPQEDQWIGVEEAIQIPCPGSDSLVSIVETEHLARTDLSSPCLSHEPQRKKKKVKKRDSSPMLSDEMVTPQCSEESPLRHCTKTKKKKQRFIDGVGEGQVGKMATASKDLGEPLDKLLEIPAGIENQPMNSIDLKIDDSVNPRRKKKRKLQEQVMEKNVDLEASLIETTEHVVIPETFHESEVVPVRKDKKQKKKKDRTETLEEEEVSLGLGDKTASNTPPCTKSETGGIDEEECLVGAEPVKKKKKKRKELENNGSWSISCDFVYPHNTEQITVEGETSSNGQKLGKKNPACLEKQLKNDVNEKKKCEGTEGDGSECSQQILQSEDTMQPKGKKKKKKKRQEETGVEVYPEIVEYGMSQESGSPSEPSEAIIEKKKKKKNRKDTVDAHENENLGVLPELSSAEEPRDVLVTCQAKEDSISPSGGELLANMKKKKKKKQIRHLELNKADKEEKERLR